MRGEQILGRKPAKPVADDRDSAAKQGADLREAYKRIEAEPPPQRLLAAFERLISGRKANPRN